MPKRVGSSLVNMMSSMERRGRIAGRLQCADRFEPAEHADRAVNSPGKGDGVGMRSRADRGQRGVRARPARKDIAGRVSANGQGQPP